MFLWTLDDEKTVYDSGLPMNIVHTNHPRQQRRPPVPSRTNAR